MKIPSSFKKSIKNTFYDKEVEIYGEPTAKDDGQGFITQEATATGETFKGNVQFDNFEELKTDYGLTEKVDIAISTDYELSAGSIIGYGGILYKVSRILERDSHNLLTATKWVNQE